MKIKPTQDHLVVKIKKQEAQTTTESGIIIKNSNPPPNNIGEVVALGPGRTLNDGSTFNMGMEVGDSVIFNQFSGTEVQGNEDEPFLFLILRANDILAILQ